MQLTDALAEAGAEEEAVDGEAVEALLDLGPPLGDGGLVEELEPPERAGGAGDAPVEPGGGPVPAEQRRERHRGGARAPRRDAPEGPELGRQPAGAGRRSRSRAAQERRLLRVRGGDALDAADGDGAVAVAPDVERDLDVLVLVLEPRAPALAVRGRAPVRRRRRRWPAAAAAAPGLARHAPLK